MNYYLLKEESQNFVVRASHNYLAHSIVQREIFGNMITVFPGYCSLKSIQPNELIRWFEKAGMSPQEIVDTLKQTHDEVVILPDEYI